MKFTAPLLSVFSVALSTHLYAMDVITVHGTKSSPTAALNDIRPVPFSQDTSAWLNGVAGAGVNSNGALSGIAQYRGMFGERVNVSNNGMNLAGAGPNSMDTPLSYAPAALIERMQIYRGIAPVSAGIDTLGGAIDVTMRSAELAEGMWLETHLNVDDNRAYKGSVLAGFGTPDFAMLSYLEQQYSATQASANGEIPNSHYKRRQYGLLTTLATNSGSIHINAHKTDTGRSGTPALPMDIDYIDTTKFELSGTHEWDVGDISWGLAHQDGRHGMDNYQQRALSSPNRARYTTATANSTSAFAHLTTDDWQIGYDAVLSNHDADIDNPNNPMFFVVNFNDVTDERHSVFAQYKLVNKRLKSDVGVRYKANLSDAGNVASSMAMMMPAVNMLQQRFNSADKDVFVSTYDITLNNVYTINQKVSMSYAFALKQHAPQYQARYLWLPMQSTGGLADGQTYTGNINLKPETARQFNAGISVYSGKLSISPQLFYQEVDDYIQGTPSDDMTVNMVATMMTNSPALQFNNIGAKLYGFDLTSQYQLNRHWHLNLNASYVRGKRDDHIKDNLYRIAPANAQLNIGYSAHNVSAQASWHVYAKQTKVSKYNQEQTSPGYGVLNLTAHMDISNTVRISAGVENLFDKLYSPHLHGINRVNHPDTPVGERLSALGRTVNIGISMQL